MAAAPEECTEWLLEQKCRAGLAAATDKVSARILAGEDGQHHVATVGSEFSGWCRQEEKKTV